MKDKTMVRGLWNDDDGNVDQWPEIRAKVEKFFREGAETERRESTIMEYLRAVDRIQKKCDITVPDDENIATVLKTMGGAASTRQLYWVICSLWRQAVVGEPLTKNRPKLEEKPVDYLKLHEVDQLLTAEMAPQHKAIVVLMLTCGARRSEVSRCDITDLDLAGRFLTIKNSEAEDVKDKDKKTKSGRIRKIPIQPKYLKFWEKYLVWRMSKGNKTNALVINAYGERFTPGGIGDIVPDIGVAAGLSRPIHPHLLRHTYGTFAARSGVPITMLSKVMGHKSITVTNDFYVGNDDLANRAAFDRVLIY